MPYNSIQIKWPEIALDPLVFWISPIWNSAQFKQNSRNDSYLHSERKERPFRDWFSQTFAIIHNLVKEGFTPITNFHTLCKFCHSQKKPFRTDLGQLDPEHVFEIPHKWKESAGRTYVNWVGTTGMHWTRKQMLGETQGSQLQQMTSAWADDSISASNHLWTSLMKLSTWSWVECGNPAAVHSNHTCLITVFSNTDCLETSIAKTRSPMFQFQMQKNLNKNSLLNAVTKLGTLPGAQDARSFLIWTKHSLMLVVTKLAACVRNTPGGGGMEG